MLTGPKAYLNAARLLKEAYRVLKPNGTYLMVSQGEPKTRLFHLERASMPFKILEQIERKFEAASKSFTHWIYVCQKPTQTNANDKHAWEQELLKIKK